MGERQVTWSAAALIFIGLLGIVEHPLPAHATPAPVFLWYCVRLFPAVVGFLALRLSWQPQRALVEAFFLIPAVMTAIFFEYLVLGPSLPWLVGFPASFQLYAGLFFLGFTACLAAHGLRSASVALQTIDYPRRALLALSAFSLLGVALLPVSGDTLYARAQRWFMAWQSGAQLAVQSPATFWLETVGPFVPILVLGLQTIYSRNRNVRHRSIAFAAFVGVALAIIFQPRDGDTLHSLTYLALRSFSLFCLYAALLSRAVSGALLSWHMPIPSSWEGSSTNLRAELLRGRVANPEQTIAWSDYRKGLRLAVDRSHRALHQQAVQLGQSPNLWILERLGSVSRPPNSSSDTEPVGQAPKLHHALARGRRLEIIALVWLLCLGLLAAQWQARTQEYSLQPSDSTTFDANVLWQTVLKPAMEEASLKQPVPVLLARKLLPQIREDLTRKIQFQRTIHGRSTIHRLLREFKPQPDKLNEPIAAAVLAALGTLEDARRSHQAAWAHGIRAPQMLRDLTRGHPDEFAQRLSREVASQLAVLQVRFMSRIGLVALVIEAESQTDSLAATAATITLNLVAPPPLLWQRLQEDTAIISARANAAYSMTFGASLHWVK